MIKQLIFYCTSIRWFILGGEKPESMISDNQDKKNEFGIKKSSKEEYQRHFRNAASNLGMLPEARKWWYRQPLEYRMEQERKWKKRYGKNWRESVVL